MENPIISSAQFSMIIFAFWLSSKLIDRTGSALTMPTFNENTDRRATKKNKK